MKPESLGGQVLFRGPQLRKRWGGMPVSTFYDLLKKGRIPAPIYPFGPTTPYWTKQAIVAHEEAAKMPLAFSLHRTKAPKDCDLCGRTVPVSTAESESEYWRVKGSPRGDLKILCCMCHGLFGFPTDGWEVAPDGREVMAAAVPRS